MVEIWSLDPPVSGHTLQQQRRPSLPRISQPNLLLTRSAADLHNYRILSKPSAAVRAFEFLCERTTGGVSAFQIISLAFAKGPCTSVAVGEVMIKLIGFLEGRSTIKPFFSVCSEAQAVSGQPSAKVVGLSKNVTFFLIFNRSLLSYHVCRHIFSNAKKQNQFCL